MEQETWPAEQCAEVDDVPALDGTPRRDGLIGLIRKGTVRVVRGRLERCHPPEVVKVTGVDGQATVVRVPSRALTYYTLNLAPILALWIGLQFVFAALQRADRAGVDLGGRRQHLQRVRVIVRERIVGEAGRAQQPGFRGPLEVVEAERQRLEHLAGHALVLPALLAPLLRRDAAVVGRDELEGHLARRPVHRHRAKGRVGLWCSSSQPDG